MKRRIITFTMIMMMLLGITGCSEKEKTAEKNEVDLCNPAIREYLDAKTEEEQAALLANYDGFKLAFQNFSFSWDRDETTKRYKVYFADNQEYADARVYETTVATVNPDGVFIPGKTYYWKVESVDTGKVLKEDSFTTKDAPVRFITTKQVHNVRDLGGWTTEDGKKIKYELIYRGGITNPYEGNNFPEEDQVLFRDVLGIKSEIDLRTPAADDRNQTVSILGEDAPYYKTPIQGYCYIIPGFRQGEPFSRANTPSINESIKEIFHVLADEANYPVYFHCNAGADRTGTIAYLINGVLGVSYEDLTRDFELTSFSAGGRRWRAEIVGGESFDSRGVMQDNYDNYVAWGKMNQMMKAKYGGATLSETIENYLMKACDVPQEDIDNLRKIMLED